MNLLAAIVQAQSQLVRDVPTAVLFDGLLAALLRLTGSEYGFLGEVLKRDGQPVLRTYAITNIAWDEETRRIYADGLAGGLEFDNLESLFGAVLRTGEQVISNDPAHDPRRGGLPAGHPPLRAFLGLPLHCGDEFVGMAGVANRPGGYTQELAEALHPFLLTCANSILAYRTEVERRRAMAELEQERARLRAVLDSALDAILTTGEDGRLLSVNPAAERMFGYSAEELLGRNVSTLVPPPHRELHDGYLREYLKTGVSGVVGTSREASARRKDGQEIPVDIAVSEVDLPGQRLFTAVVKDLSERNETRRRLERLRDELERARYGNFLGSSPAMRQLYELIDEVARGDWTTLIVGETGSGKELVARALHAASRRREGPFVAVNCAGLTDSLLASQLFGHRRGAFTGAVRDQEGLFQAAAGGTIFLDEIGDVSPSMQVSLLRVLQEGEVVPLGETRPRKVDVRVLAATHRDLDQIVASGAFRLDLLYRLRVARIEVPPLRDRGDDVLLLAESFLAQARLTSGKAITGFSPRARQLLRDHPWPGNVRELRSAIEHAVIRCRGHLIEPTDLPAELLPRPDAAPTVPQLPSLDPAGDLRRALDQAGGNRARAARLLGISRATLYRRLKELGDGGDTNAG